MDAGPPRLDLQVSDTAAAQTALAPLALDVTILPEGHLSVVASPDRAAEVNRNLVQAGVDVFALSPQRADLGQTFERLVAEQRSSEGMS